MRYLRQYWESHCEARVALGLALLVAIAGSTRLTSGVCGVYHDDAIYVSTAKSLADGDGYRLMGVPGAPRQTKYPILYPAILALVWRVFPAFPENLLLMQCLSLAAGAATVALAYLYLVRSGYFSHSIALMAGVSCAVSSGYLYFSTLTMAEATFALSFVLALWAVDHRARSGESNLSVELGVGMLAALPFLLRTIGAPLMPVALWVFYRRGQRLPWYLVGMTLVALPWIVWSLTAWGSWERDPVEGYYTDYLGSWTTTGLHLLGRVISQNAAAIIFGAGELSLGSLMSFCSDRLPGLISLVVVFLPGLLACFALARHFRQRRVLPVAVIAYLLIVLVWSWPPYRFLMPLLPYLAAYFYAGAAAVLGSFLSPRAMRGVAAAFLLCLLTINLHAVALQGQLLRATGYPRIRVTDLSIHWSSYQDVFTWLTEHSEDDAVVASGLDSMLSLYTGRKAYRPFVYSPDKLFYGNSSEPLITVPQLAIILQSQETDYLVRLPMPDYSEEEEYHETIRQLRTEFPEWLRPVYQGEDDRFAIYRLDPRHAPAAARGTAPRAIRAAAREQRPEVRGTERSEARGTEGQR